MKNRQDLQDGKDKKNGKFGTDYTDKNGFIRRIRAGKNNP